MIPAGFERVRRGRPCPVCGRPDWCLVASDGSRAICARRDSDRRWGEAGHLHILTERGRAIGGRVEIASVPRIDFAAAAARFAEAVQDGALEALGRSLGVAPEVLVRLNVGWAARGELALLGTRCRSEGAWTFPMRDDAGRIIGIRLRGVDGFKWALAGSRNGLFIPDGTEPSGELLLPEGATDTAALAGLGFAVAGRPSCTAGTRLLVRLVHRFRPSRVVVVLDADEPGRRGAGSLACVLRAYTRDVRVIAPSPPLKDARAWVQAGASAEDVRAVIEAACSYGLAVRGPAEVVS